MALYPPSRFRIRYEPKQLRWIEHEYAIELTAYNSEQIRSAQAQLLRLQAAAAITNLRSMDGIVRTQAQTVERLTEIEQNTAISNEYLNKICSNVETMARQLDGIEQGVDRINNNLEQTNEILESGFRLLFDSLQNISCELYQHTKQLTTISQQLRSQFKMQAEELRVEAENCLREGLRTEGQDQKDYWDDALRLYQATVDNHIGKQDYVAWFQIGYLRWIHLQDVVSAEKAFDIARRLSAPKRDLYHLTSLRYLAHMRYLLVQYEEAYSTIQQAYNLSQDHNTLYEYARYSAKTGRKEQALELLDKCIDLEPFTYTVMFAEEDFECLW